MRRVVLTIVCAIAIAAFAGSASAHCEVPCGIYDDEMRFRMIDEHITTIEKAINQIVELSKATPVNYNQVVRWTTNKEKHATRLQHIISQYFLTQRVKPAKKSDDQAAQDKYTKLCTVSQRLLVGAMKCKQTTDLTHVEHLRKLRSELYTAYFGEGHEEHEH